MVCSFLPNRTYFLWSKFTAITLASKLHQATMFGVITRYPGLLYWQRHAENAKISYLLNLSDNSIDTITKSCPWSRTAVQARV